MSMVFSERKLNASLVDKAATLLEAKGYLVRVVTAQDGCHKVKLIQLMYIAIIT